jgi:cell division protein FtsA
MVQNNYVMSLDIGTTKIAAVVGKINSHGRVVVEASAVKESQGIRRGMVENVEESVQSIKQCLDALYANEHSKVDVRAIKEVTVGIAGQHISSMQNSTSRIRDKPHELITEKELQEMQKDMYKIQLKPGQTILHVTPQDYIIDGSPVRRAVGCDGSKLACSYHIVVCETSAIKKLQTCVERCGLRLKKLVLEPFASADAVLTEDERKDGVAMLDIGGGTSDLIIYHDNVVRGSAVIPCGGEVITNDIRELCAINRTMAEYAKQEFGSCFPDSASGDDGITFQAGIGRAPRVLKFRTLAEIIQARMDEIIEALDYKITESGYSERISSIVLTGGGSLLKNLTQLVKLRTGFDARVGIPCVQPSGSTPLRNVSPTLATSVGLVMRGCEDMEKIGDWFSGLSIVKKVTDKILVRVDKVFDESDVAI